ncbi:hypothetical protein EGR_05132 [Echinococcus granulosus]|uniref:Uncharacterized protein n=1 Tax=Echinococcus granulosus TaxID=6210 RepID=W6UG75_ECHGR|nr:hypothetical protein EGR_05132 [Echinococcus granulosus]EUB59971.1 hypothetical protein EGR_05132 [Echinococcus granulosus]
MDWALQGADLVPFDGGLLIGHRSALEVEIQSPPLATLPLQVPGLSNQSASNMRAHTCISPLSGGSLVPLLLFLHLFSPSPTPETRHPAPPMVLVPLLTFLACLLASVLACVLFKVPHGAPASSPHAKRSTLSVDGIINNSAAAAAAAAAAASASNAYAAGLQAAAAAAIGLGQLADLSAVYRQATAADQAKDLL